MLRWRERRRRRRGLRFWADGGRAGRGSELGHRDGHGPESAVAVGAEGSGRGRRGSPGRAEFIRVFGLPPGLFRKPERVSQ